MKLLTIAILLFAVVEVCLWRIAKKCDLYGWEGIIPLYNIYAISSAIGQLNLGLCTIVLGMVPIITLCIESPIIAGINIVALVGACTAFFVLLGFLCDYLDRSMLWMYCAIFLPIVFFLILAFTDSRHYT